MDIVDRSITACFSGHRPHKFDFPLHKNNYAWDAKYDNFIVTQTQTIFDAIDVGYRNFLFGGAPGYDIVCAELVAKMKKAFGVVRLVCVLPYSSFPDSKHFDEKWRYRYEMVLPSCDSVINATGLSFHTRGCYQTRNKFMVNNSSRLICYHTDKSGGTANTIQYADTQGIEIINTATPIKES